MVMIAMRCPLCRAALTENDLRCPRCDALLERLPFTSLNLADSPADIPDPTPFAGSTKVELGGDATIVGALGGDFSSWSGSGDALLGLSADEYLEAPTGIVERLILTPQVYVDEGVARMLKPEAVLKLLPGDDEALSLFERHMASFLDGDRPLARVARKANVTLDDARIALALLVEKKRAVLVGHMIVPERYQEATPQKPQPRVPPIPQAPSAPRHPASVVEKPAAPVRPPMQATPPSPPQAARDTSATTPPIAHERPFDPAKRAPPPDAFRRYGEQQDVRLLKLAMEKEEAGLYDDAVRLLRRAIEVNPRAAVLYNRLGVVLATRLRDYVAACDALVRACELEPKNHTYMGNLAKVAERAEAARDEREREKNNFGGMFKRRK